MYFSLSVGKSRRVNTNISALCRQGLGGESSPATQALLLRKYQFLLFSSISRWLFSATDGAAASTCCACPADVAAVVHVVLVTGKSRGGWGSSGQIPKSLVRFCLFF